jgi:hypothetical protein
MNLRSDSQLDRHPGCSNPESLAAYARVQPTKQHTCDQIMDFAARCEFRGFICDELAAAWGCPHNHTSPRCSELVKSGLLFYTGRTRPTRAGNPARVLVAKQFARLGAPTVVSQPQSAEELPTTTDSLFGNLTPESRYPWRDPEEG